MRTQLATLIIGFCCLGATPRQLFSVTPKATDEARRWVGAKFLGQSPSITDQAYLLVYTKSGGVDRDAIDEKPLRIGSRQYQGGIHFSAGKVVVHLPQAARSFEAVVGADSNRDGLGYSGGALWPTQPLALTSQGMSCMVAYYWHIRVLSLP
jgi:hypothetical protein